MFERRPQVVRAGRVARAGSTPKRARGFLPHPPRRARRVGRPTAPGPALTVRPIRRRSPGQDMSRTPGERPANPATSLVPPPAPLPAPRRPSLFRPRPGDRGPGSIPYFGLAVPRGFSGRARGPPVRLPSVRRKSFRNPPPRDRIPFASVLEPCLATGAGLLRCWGSSDDESALAVLTLVVRSCLPAAKVPAARLSPAGRLESNQQGQGPPFQRPRGRSQGHMKIISPSWEATTGPRQPETQRQDAPPSAPRAGQRPRSLLLSPCVSSASPCGDQFSLGWFWAGPGR